MRVVHWVVDPTTGERFPIGVVVAAGDRVVGIPWTGAENRLPSPAREAVREAIEHVATATSLDALPPPMGPQVEWLDPVEIPASFGDPVAWVKRHLMRRDEAA